MTPRRLWHAMKDISGEMRYTGNIVKFHDVYGEELLSNPNDDSRYQHESYYCGKEVGSISDGDNAEMLVDFYKFWAWRMERNGNSDVGPNNDQGNDKIWAGELTGQEKGGRGKHDTERHNVRGELHSDVGCQSSKEQRELDYTAEDQPSGV
mmetsp:Transcript_89534/g.134224  ORF Transcript_89534/g.134224 Transcript_89534/m.134224 type:complete len:151 (-) Transcript_89534:135-587(-)